MSDQKDDKKEEQKDDKKEEQKDDKKENKLNKDDKKDDKPIERKIFKQPPIPGIDDVKEKERKYLHKDVDAYLLKENPWFTDHQKRIYHQFQSIHSKQEHIMNREKEEKAFANLISLITGNILNDPSNSKFHQIKLSNKTIKQKFLMKDTPKKCIDLLKLGGFEQRVVFKTDSKKRKWEKIESNTNQLDPTQIKQRKEDQEDILIIAEPNNIKDLCKLSDVWFLAKIRIWYKSYEPGVTMTHS